jgi:plasmid stabilization system protein ParE
MYYIEYSEETKEDIENLSYWISEEKGMPKTAMKYVDDLLETIQEMAKRPTSYPFERNLSVLQLYGMNVRRVNFKKFAILYAIIEEEQTVYIYRVIASSMITGLN